MKIFVSDLHVGSPLFRDGKRLIELFNDPKVEEIYILGDVLDVWHKDVTTITRLNALFIDAINSCSKIKVILKGNHDPDIDTMRSVFYNTIVTDKFEMDLFGKKAILIHGDEFDKRAYRRDVYFKIHKFFSKYEINLKAFVRNIVYSYAMFKKGLSNNDLVLQGEIDVFNKYSRDYDIIVMGHSHLPKMVRKKDADYLNCGCIVYKPTYLAAEKNTIFLKRL